ncbi:DNA polymerase III subunit beta [Neobacillus sp.]|jgi:DNA polymerase III subunit beta|uniref:DNA polymerase III subunit beta n=1 Tax=Neobacillus sp. TaxID=2675273 RepID=UPI0035B54881
MHFKIGSQLFADALKKVEKVVNSKHNIPILQGIFLKVTEQEIICIGSDSTESFRYHIPVGEHVHVITPGTTVLPKQIIDITKKLKKDLELQLRDCNLTIKYGKKSEFNLNTFDPEEYPRLPKFDIDSPTLTLKGTDFNSLVKKTAFAASDSEIRPLLQGVHLITENNCMKWVCTDSHRLSQVTTKIDHNNPIKLVIPAKSLDRLVKTFNLQEDVRVYCESDNQVIFKNGNLFFYSRLLEGNYPDTSRLIPNDFKAEMKINRKELLEGLDRISGLANGVDGGSGVVKLHVNGVATITTHQSQIGKGIEAIEYEELTGEDDFTISFAANYMIDALKAIDDDVVNFKYQGNARPFLITPTSSEFEETQLILPVRTM